MAGEWGQEVAGKGGRAGKERGGGKAGSPTGINRLSSLEPSEFFVKNE